MFCITIYAYMISFVTDLKHIDGKQLIFLLKNRGCQFRIFWSLLSASRYKGEALINFGKVFLSPPLYLT